MRKGAGEVFHGLLPFAVDGFVLRANVADFNAEMEFIVAYKNLSKSIAGRQ